YIRQFITISNYLVKEKVVSASEQQQAMITGVHEGLRNQVLARLQVLFPHVKPDIFYEVKDIKEAVLDILQFLVQLTGTLVASTVSSMVKVQEATVMGIKQEQINQLFTTIDQLQKRVKQQGQWWTPGGGGGGGGPRGGGGSLLLCNFCGQAGHFIRECLNMAVSIAAGKCLSNPCQRDVYGRIVLPLGAMVPRVIPGETFEARIDKYH
ncbi:hypothetical protein BV22DRAFT_1026693, partial [Leucogyrophana mollusca]